MALYAGGSPTFNESTGAYGDPSLKYGALTGATGQATNPDGSPMRTALNATPSPSGGFSQSPFANIYQNNGQYYLPKDQLGALSLSGGGVDETGVYSTPDVRYNDPSGNMAQGFIPGSAFGFSQSNQPTTSWSDPSGYGDQNQFVQNQDWQNNLQFTTDPATGKQYINLGGATTGNSGAVGPFSAYRTQPSGDNYDAALLGMAAVGGVAAAGGVAPAAADAGAGAGAGAGASGGYTGADAAAYNAGINPETGEAMNLGAQQLGVAGTDVAGDAGAAVQGGAGGAGAAAGGAAPIAGPGSVAAGGAGGAAAGGTALSRLLDGSSSNADLASLLGTAASTGLGIAGANQQANASNALASRLFDAGQASRDRFNASMTPGFDPTTIPGYSGALDNASQSILRGLSASGGNPFGNPGGLIEANKQIVNGTALPAVQAYQNANAAAGGFGALAAGAPGAGANAVGAQGGIFNAIGSGISSLTNPQPTLADTLRMLGLGRGATSAA